MGSSVAQDTESVLRRKRRSLFETDKQSVFSINNLQKLKNNGIVPQIQMAHSQRPSTGYSCVTYSSAVSNRRNSTFVAGSDRKAKVMDQVVFQFSRKFGNDQNTVEAIRQEAQSVLMPNPYQPKEQATVTDMDLIEVKLKQRLKDQIPQRCKSQGRSRRQNPAEHSQLYQLRNQKLFSQHRLREYQPHLLPENQTQIREIEFQSPKPVESDVNQWEKNRYIQTLVPTTVDACKNTELNSMSAAMQKIAVDRFKLKQQNNQSEKSDSSTTKSNLKMDKLKTYLKTMGAQSNLNTQSFYKQAHKEATNIWQEMRKHQDNKKQQEDDEQSKEKANMRCQMRDYQLKQMATKKRCNTQQKLEKRRERRTVDAETRESFEQVMLKTRNAKQAVTRVHLENKQRAYSKTANNSLEPAPKVTEIIDLSAVNDMNDLDNISDVQQSVIGSQISAKKFQNPKRAKTPLMVKDMNARELFFSTKTQDCQRQQSTANQLMAKLQRRQEEHKKQQELEFGKYIANSPQGDYMNGQLEKESQVHQMKITAIQKDHDYLQQRAHDNYTTQNVSKLSQEQEAAQKFIIEQELQESKFQNQALKQRLRQEQLRKQVMEHNSEMVQQLKAVKVPVSGLIPRIPLSDKDKRYDSVKRGNDKELTLQGFTYTEKPINVDKEKQKELLDTQIVENKNYRAERRHNDMDQTEVTINRKHLEKMFESSEGATLKSAQTAASTELASPQ